MRLSRNRHRVDRLAAIAIVAVGVLAYANSLHGAFLFDDSKHIVDNPRIRRLWPIWETFTPPPNEGRPVVAVTLAVNYGVSGLDTWSYHVFNVSVHILAALTLFGIVRRTLAPSATPDPARRTGASGLAHDAGIVALAAALLFVVHPLQTQAVTYVIQRSESLAGLLYLVTLYAVIRSVAPGARTAAWQTLAVAACATGMGTKQVMVTAPIAVLLYDRCFLSGEFRVALQTRWRLYLALASTWLPLALLQWLSPNPGAGLQRDVGPWAYLATQSGVVVHYLRLALLPVELCLDYAWPVATTFREIVPPALIVLALLAATAWALVRRPAAGFCGAVFFLILAPSSTILPISQLAAEHRMYLSLAALVTLVVAAMTTLARRGPAAARPIALAALGVTVVAGVILTHRRNEDYRSAAVMWRDVVDKAPWNPAAYNNLAHALLQGGAPEDAVSLLQRAIALDAEDWHPHKNLGDAYYALGRFAEAGASYRSSLAHRPDEAGTFEISYNLALVRIQQGDVTGAIPALQQAMAMNPSHPRPYATLGALLLDSGDLAGARRHLERAAELQPTPSVLSNLAAIAVARGDREAAARLYREALGLDPAHAAAAAGLRDLERVPRR